MGKCQFDYTFAGSGNELEVSVVESFVALADGDYLPTHEIEMWQGTNLVTLNLTREQIKTLTHILEAFLVDTDQNVLDACVSDVVVV